MTAFDELARNPVLRDLIQEARRNLAARNAPEPFDFEDGPQPVSKTRERAGKSCAACRRPFHAAGEYLVCRACEAQVCRKGNCKHVHHAAHRVAHLQQQGKETA